MYVTINSRSDVRGVTDLQGNKSRRYADNERPLGEYLRHINYLPRCLFQDFQGRPLLPIHWAVHRSPKKLVWIITRRNNNVV